MTTTFSSLAVHKPIAIRSKIVNEQRTTMSQLINPIQIDSQKMIKIPVIN